MTIFQCLLLQVESSGRANNTQLRHLYTFMLVDSCWSRRAHGYGFLRLLLTHISDGEAYRDDVIPISCITTDVRNMQVPAVFFFFYCFTPPSLIDVETYTRENWAYTKPRTRESRAVARTDGTRGQIVLDGCNIRDIHCRGVYRHPAACHLVLVSLPVFEGVIYHYTLSILLF